MGKAMRGERRLTWSANLRYEPRSLGKDANKGTKIHLTPSLKVIGVFEIDIVFTLLLETRYSSWWTSRKQVKSSLLCESKVVERDVVAAGKLQSGGDLHVEQADRSLRTCMYICVFPSPSQEPTGYFTDSSQS